MRDFIKLQLKLSYGFNKNGNKKSTILTGTMSIVVAVVMLGIVYLFASVLSSSVTSVSIPALSTLFLTIVQVGLLVMGVTMQIKRLYRPNDLEITARFPLSDAKMYLANIILVYINMAIYGFILTFPVMLAFGFAAKVVTFKFVMGTLLASLISPLVPFGLSLIIAIPIMYILQLLEQHNIVKLVLFILILVGFFILYNYILTLLSQYFLEENNIDSGTVDIWAKVVGTLNHWYNPAALLHDVVFFESFGFGFGIFMAMGVVLSAIGIAVATPTYKYFRRNILEGGGARWTKKTKIDDHGAARAMFNNGFKNILRTRTYAYFYLGIAIATPVMVFLCNKLISDVGNYQVGSTINFGASVLVIAAFMAMISAFSGMAISMEGKKFYITKIIPVPYRTQLLLKVLLNLIVSVGALLISLVILISLKFITFVQLIVLLFAMLLLSVGFVLNGLNLNLANPNMKQKANGETDEINISITMLLGLFLSAILGFACIIIPFFAPMWVAYILILGLAVIYAGVNAIVFFKTCEKKYSKIEV